MADRHEATAGQGAMDRLPSQVKYIVGNEACERLSYYGMLSILTGYITGQVAEGGLGQSTDFSTNVTHFFKFVNYVMPLLGGLLSDLLLGRYYTILYVSFFYCAGHGVLASSDLWPTVDGKLTCLYSGLALIAFGSGGIKPCVSAFMGDQFKPEQGHLLQKAYGAFYWAINFGSFFSFLVIPFVKDHYGYALAFAVPGILMALATLIFWRGRKQYVRVPPSRQTQTAGFFRVIFTALVQRRSRGQGFWDPVRNRFSAAEVDAAASVLPILRVFALIPFFWALFDQTNSTWIVQGNKMHPFNLLWFTIGAEQMQSANPAMVMLLVPLLTLLIYPRLGRLATPLRRMSAGMFCGALSYVVVAWLQQQIESGRQLSVLWQLLPYLVLTIGEVLVSTTGLEFAFAEADPSMRSTIMSFWMLAVAAGNLVVVVMTWTLGGGAAHESSVSSHRFILYAVLMAVVAVLFSLMVRSYRYRHSSYKKLIGL